MRDLRVNVWNPVTVSADGTTYGPTIDLLADYVGDYIYGTGDYGIGVEMMAKNVVTGTGDGFTLTWGWQHSTDGSSWDEYGEIGTMTIDTDGNFLKADGSVFALTRQKLKSRVVTARKYLRLKCVAAGISGGESADLSAFLADGTIDQLDSGVLS